MLNYWYVSFLDMVLQIYKNLEVNFDYTFLFSNLVINLYIKNNINFSLNIEKIILLCVIIGYNRYIYIIYNKF